MGALVDKVWQQSLLLKVVGRYGLGNNRNSVIQFRFPVNVRNNPQTELPGGKASCAADHSWRLPEDSLEYILSTLEISMTNPLITNENKR